MGKNKRFKKAKKEKQKKKRSFFRWLVCWGLRFVLAVVVTVCLCNLFVILKAQGRHYSNLQDVPYRKVGVVLGTTPRTRNGNKNHYYYIRMQAAAELYFAKKISYIIVSGDNHKREYNEPEYMRNSLMELGVPDSALSIR